MVSPIEDSETSAVSENEKLIKVLERGFSDLQEQSRRQGEQAKRLQQAVENLKPRIHADKTAEFWNAYKTLADEHDKEFKERYSTDLNTGLVFAGLFSAVDSAFIIQIQPEIEHHGGPPIVVVAQGLLYISLCSTLLAALLGVLGMQWLGYYSAVEARGSIAERGRGRQEKVDGLRRWKFDMVMQTFPLLLQFALLVFSVALSVYLWNNHLVHAIIVLCFTAAGFLFYMYFTFLISAIAAPHSLFQTWLAQLISHLVQKISKSSKTPVQRILDHLCHTSTCSPTKPVLPLSHVQQNSLGNHGTETIFLHPFPEPSPEVPAVAWMLETSTDPCMLDLAAKMAVDLQWKTNMDLRPQLNRLLDGLLECFEFTKKDTGEYYLKRLLEGMALHALHLGRAYCALRWAFKIEGAEHHPPRFIWVRNTSELPLEKNTLRWELVNMIRVLTGDPVNWRKMIESDLDLATKWTLQVLPSVHPQALEGVNISAADSKHRAFKHFLDKFDQDAKVPALDHRSFTDYLFCIYTLMLESTVSSQDLARVDKSTVQLEVLQVLFNTLVSLLKENKISMDIIAKIIKVTGRLAKQGKDVWYTKTASSTWSRQAIINGFCMCLQEFEGWDSVVLVIGPLTETYKRTSHPTSGDPHWVFKALEKVGDNMEGITGLFNAFLYYGAPQPPPNKNHIQLMVELLSNPGQVSTTAAHVLLVHMEHWLQDDDVRLILQKDSVWASLMRATCKDLDLAREAILLGNILAGIPDWQPLIQRDVCSWITIFFNDEQKEVRDLVAKYNSVLSTVWKLDIGDYSFRDPSEQALALTFLALRQLWEDFNFDVLSCADILRCTNLAVLRGGYRPLNQTRPGKIGAEFITAFSVPFHETLLRVSAGFRVYSDDPSNLAKLGEKREAIGIISRILEETTSRMPSSKADVLNLEKTKLDWKYWKELRRQVAADLLRLEDILSC